MQLFFVSVNIHIYYMGYETKIRILSDVWYETSNMNMSIYFHTGNTIFFFSILSY